MNKADMRKAIAEARKEYQGEVTKLAPEFAFRETHTKFDGTKNHSSSQYVGPAKSITADFSREPRVFKKGSPKKVAGNEIAAIMAAKAKGQAIKRSIRHRDYNAAARKERLTTI